MLAGTGKGGLGLAVIMVWMLREQGKVWEWGGPSLCITGRVGGASSPAQLARRYTGTYSDKAEICKLHT